jgi:hypothetical protein
MVLSLNLQHKKKTKTKERKVRVSDRLSLKELRLFSKPSRFLPYPTPLPLCPLNPGKRVFKEGSDFNAVIEIFNNSIYTQDLL